MVRRMLITATVVLVLLIAGACGGDDGSSEAQKDDSGATDEQQEPSQGGKVVVALNQEPEGFNIATNRLTPGALNVAKAIYDPITWINPEGVAEPYLVEDIQPNDDFTEWTITLREGVEFHNGDPLTPQVLATHLKKVQEAPLTFFSVEPIEAVAVLDEAARPMLEAGEITEEEYNLQKRQVAVVMAEPWATFPAFLGSLQLGYVPHPDFVDGATEDPIGTGPFEWGDWVSGDSITVERNDGYWRDGLPYLDQVEFQWITEGDGRLRAVSSGDADLMITSEPSQVKELSTGELEEGLALYESQGGGDEQLLIFNNQSGVTADESVRKAIQLSTDPEALNEKLYDGFFDLADAPFPPDSVWYRDPGWPEPDIDRATALVEEWEAANGPLRIAITTVSNQDNLALGQTLSEQWSEAGIEAEIEGIPEAELGNVLPSGNFDAVMLQFFPGSDPDEHFPFWEPDPENIGGPGEISVNFARYTSPESREALEAARRTRDQQERAELYGQVWQDWAEHVPYLWLYHSAWLLVASDRVHGLDDVTFPNGEPAAGFVWGSVFLTQAWIGD